MDKRNYMLTAEDLAKELCCSKQKAYKIIRELVYQKSLK